MHINVNLVPHVQMINCTNELKILEHCEHVTLEYKMQRQKPIKNIWAPSQFVCPFSISIWPNSATCVVNNNHFSGRAIHLQA